jgi:hypothetical protein
MAAGIAAMDAPNIAPIKSEIRTDGSELLRAYVERGDKEANQQHCLRVLTAGRGTRWG